MNFYAGESLTKKLFTELTKFHNGGWPGHSNSSHPKPFVSQILISKFFDIRILREISCQPDDSKIREGDTLNKTKVVPAKVFPESARKIISCRNPHEARTSPHFQRHQVSVGYAPGFVVHRHRAIIPRA